MKKVIFLLFILISSGFVSAQNISVSGMGSVNFGLELCNVDNCTKYLGNETIPLESNVDYVLLIQPENINNTRKLAEYVLGNNFVLNFIMFLVFLFLLITILWVISNVR